MFNLIKMGENIINYILLYLPLGDSIDFELTENNIYVEFTYFNQINVRVVEKEGESVSKDYMIPFPAIPYIYEINMQNINTVYFKDESYQSYELEYFIEQFEIIVREKKEKQKYKDLINYRKKFLDSFGAEKIKEAVANYKRLKYNIISKDIIEELNSTQNLYLEAKKKFVERYGMVADEQDLEKLDELEKHDMQTQLNYIENLKKRIDRYSNIINKEKFLDIKTGQKLKIKQRQTEVKFPKELLHDVEQGIQYDRRIDFILYEKLWNDRENYGPVIASLILLGAIQYRIDMRALMNIWISFKKKIISIANNLKKDKSSNIPLFIRIYENLVTNETECVYAKGNTNFLSDLYISGKCNCQCGSYLGFILWQMYPENCRCFPVVVPGHIFLIVLEDGKFYNFETTAVTDYFRPIDKLPDDIKFIITSEQILGLYSLQNLGTRLDLNKDIFHYGELSEYTMNYMAVKLFGTGLIYNKDVQSLRNIDIILMNSNLAKTPFDLLALLYILMCDNLKIKYELVFRKEIDTQLSSNFNDSKIYTKEDLKKYWHYILDICEKNFGDDVDEIGKICINDNNNVSKNLSTIKLY